MKGAIFHGSATLLQVGDFSVLLLNLCWLRIASLFTHPLDAPASISAELSSLIIPCKILPFFYNIIKSRIAKTVANFTPTSQNHYRFSLLRVYVPAERLPTFLF